MFRLEASSGLARRLVRIFPALGLAALAACSGPLKPTPFGSVLPPPAILCADFSFSIYFEKGSDQLTEAAKQELGYAAERVRGCRLGTVEVLGLADADGAAHRNLVLSRQRAAVVARALGTAGLPAPTFDLEALGGEGAITSSGEPEPLRRKTEVVIRASPQPSSAARSPQG